MINGYPTAFFMSGSENTHIYRWLMRSTGHVYFSDAVVDTHVGMMMQIGISGPQVVAYGYYNPQGRICMVNLNETKMSKSKLMQYVTDAFDEKSQQDAPWKEIN